MKNVCINDSTPTWINGIARTPLVDVTSLSEIDLDTFMSPRLILSTFLIHGTFESTSTRTRH